MTKYSTMLKTLFNYSKLKRLCTNKFLISLSLVTSGYVSYNYFDDTSSVYVRFLRTFYIGMVNSLDYKLSLFGLEENSQNYKVKINLCHQRSAERILDGCLKNGGLYIKLGQGLVAMNHILPQQYISTLEQLHDKASPKSFEKVKKVFLEDLGHEPHELFSEFNTDPFAAASLAQVHEAVYKSNERVAVKVQYHDLRSRFHADIRTLEILLYLVELIHPTFGFSWVLKDMKVTLAQELDFENEAENSKRCAKDLKSFRDVHIPKVYDDLCSKRILTMEYIDGVKVNDVNKLKQAKINLKWLDKLLIQVFSHQLFHTGFVHADPHPGNILVQMNKSNFPRLIILDHGLYESMNDHQRHHLACLIKSLISCKFSDTKYFSNQLGVHDWKTFGEIILQRPLNFDDMNQDFKIFQSKLSDEDINQMKKKSSQHFDKIMTVLRQMPKPMLLFIRNLNTVRSILHLHGDPINRYIYMTDSAIRAGYIQQISSNFLYYQIVLLLELEIFKWRIRISELKDTVNRIILRILNYFGYGISIEKIQEMYLENNILN